MINDKIEKNTMALIEYLESEKYIKAFESTSDLYPIKVYTKEIIPYENALINQYCELSAIIRMDGTLRLQICAKAIDTDYVQESVAHKTPINKDFFTYKLGEDVFVGDIIDIKSMKSIIRSCFGYIETGTVISISQFLSKISLDSDDEMSLEIKKYDTIDETLAIEYITESMNGKSNAKKGKVLKFDPKSNNTIS